METLKASEVSSTAYSSRGDKLFSGEIKLFAFAGGLASMTRLAYVLRAGKRVTFKMCLIATFQGLMAGIIVALLTYKYIAVQREAVYVWYAMCGLAGFGGIGLLEFLFELLKAALSRGVELSNGGTK